MGKLWRVKRRGKFIGSWRVTIKGREINLDTKDATEATRRARLAARGQWPQEENAAAAVAAAFQGFDGDTPPEAPAPEVPAPAGVDVTPSPAPAVPPPAAPLVPEVMPSQNWAADAGEAAAEGSPGAAAAGDAPPAGANVGGLDLSALIDTAANLTVDLQLQLQAYAMKRAQGRQAGDIPPDNNLRQIGVEMWRQQFKIWLPADLALPPWLAALVVTGICGVQQYATSTPVAEGEARRAA